MTEPDNLVLIQLRELRAELKASEERIAQRLDVIDKRLDAMHLNGVKALRGFIGHRSMAERAMASFEDEIAQLRRRFETLEGAPT